MSEKKLPIVLKPAISSECWTYYKFAVIQTMPNLTSWFTNHLRLFIDQNSASLYGENGEMYSLSYFSDILNIKAKDIFSISSNHIIDFIISTLEQGNYLIMDLNFSKLHNVSNPTFHLHETLIYGYNTDSREFMTSIRFHGSFKETRISFQTLISSYTDVLLYYSDNPTRLFSRRRYFFPITTIKPKTILSNPNALFDIYQKLKFELNEYVYVRNSSLSDKKYSYYTGLSYLLFLKEYQKSLATFPEITYTDIRKNQRACLKLYEYQCILLRLIKYVNNTTASNSTLDNLVHDYSMCCKKLYTNVLLSYKYQNSINNIIFSRIAENLDAVYAIESPLLETILHKIETEI